MSIARPPPNTDGCQVSHKPSLNWREKIVWMRTMLSMARPNVSVLRPVSFTPWRRWMAFWVSLTTKNQHLSSVWWISHAYAGLFVNGGRSFCAITPCSRRTTSSTFSGPACSLRSLQLAGLSYLHTRTHCWNAEFYKIIWYSFADWSTKYLPAQIRKAGVRYQILSI
jgi:hypothetical protein